MSAPSHTDPSAARRRALDPDEVAIRRTLGEPLWDGEPPLPKPGEPEDRCATLPPMPTLPPAPPVPSPPSLSELARCAVVAALDSQGAWARLPPSGQREVKRRLRWVLDEVAKRMGVEPGSIYGVSPSDPPPSAPGP